MRKLSEVLFSFADQAQWTELVRFAGSETNALVLLNAPVAQEPEDAFWGTAYSLEDNHARHKKCEMARELRTTIVSELQAGRLIAYGFLTTSANRVRIDSDRWGELHPLFATNRAVGLVIEFRDVVVVERDREQADSSKVLLRDVERFLEDRRNQGFKDKKTTLLESAKNHFKDRSLTETLFNAAYASVFNHGRGRPHS